MYTKMKTLGDFLDFDLWTFGGIIPESFDRANFATLSVVSFLLALVTLKLLSYTGLFYGSKKDDEQDQDYSQAIQYPVTFAREIDKWSIIYSKFERYCDPDKRDSKHALLSLIIRQISEGLDEVMTMNATKTALMQLHRLNVISTDTFRAENEDLAAIEWHVNQFAKTLSEKGTCNVYAVIRFILNRGNLGPLLWNPNPAEQNKES